MMSTWLKTNVAKDPIKRGKLNCSIGLMDILIVGIGNLPWINEMAAISPTNDPIT